MVTCDMGVIVAGLGHISTSLITIDIYSTIVRGRVAVILIPKLMISVINTYITPLVTIITTYISPLMTIISNHINPLIAMTTISYYLIFVDIVFNKTRIKLETQQFTTATWVMG